MAEDFEERFLLHVKSDEDSWKALKCSLQSGFKSRLNWLYSTNLAHVIFLMLLIFISFLLSYNGFFVGILYGVNLGISAFKLAKISKSKVALKNLEGEYSLEAIETFEKRWLNRRK